jgi:hypothetical protein
MNFESEAFALYVQPLVTFAYFHHYLTSIKFTWPDVYCLIFSFAIRTITLLIFIRIMTSPGECIGFGDKATKKIIGTICVVLYGCYLTYFIMTDNDSLFSQVCIRSEMIMLPLVLFWYSSNHYDRIATLKRAVNADAMYAQEKRAMEYEQLVSDLERA